jgi:hypothetical protein
MHSAATQRLSKRSPMNSAHQDADDLAEGQGHHDQNAACGTV